MLRVKVSTNSPKAVKINTSGIIQQYEEVIGGVDDDDDDDDVVHREKIEEQNDEPEVEGLISRRLNFTGPIGKLAAQEQITRGRGFYQMRLDSRKRQYFGVRG